MSPVAGQPMALRPEVSEFAQAMEWKLRQNDHKGGWRRCTRGYLLRRLATETRELRAALRRQERRLKLAQPLDPGEAAALAAEVLREAADVANFCMMLADDAGGLRGLP